MKTLLYVPMVHDPFSEILDVSLKAMRAKRDKNDTSLENLNIFLKYYWSIIEDEISKYHIKRIYLEGCSNTGVNFIRKVKRCAKNGSPSNIVAEK